MRRYERRGGRWYDSEDGTEHDGIRQLRRNAFRRCPDRLARYWNARVDMRLLALRHEKESGYDDELTEEEYARRRDELEASKQSGEYIDVRYIDDRTQSWMFTASNVTLNPQFKLMTDELVAVKLGEITEKTIVYCPKHETDISFHTHAPSAFVGIDRSGRRYVHCSRCGGPGRSIKETWLDSASEPTWKDLETSTAGSRQADREKQRGS